MKHFVLVFLLAIFVVAVAPAVYADTLHVYCVPPAAPCSDNGTITPTSDNPPYFAFNYSGNLNNAHGNLWLIGLVADNQNAGFGLTLEGVNTTQSSATASLLSATEWNSGFLSAFMSAQSAPFSFSHPSHPLDAYLPSTQAVDSGANGYFAYLFDFGAFDYQTAPGDPTFSVGSGTVPVGTIFLSVVTDNNNIVAVDTSNGGSLLEAVPEPATLQLLGCSIVGLAGALRRKTLP